MDTLNADEIRTCISGVRMLFQRHASEYRRCTRKFGADYQSDRKRACEATLARTVKLELKLLRILALMEGADLTHLPKLTLPPELLA